MDPADMPGNHWHVSMMPTASCREMKEMKEIKLYLLPLVILLVVPLPPEGRAMQTRVVLDSEIRLISGIGALEIIEVLAVVGLIVALNGTLPWPRAEEVMALALVHDLFLDPVLVRVLVLVLVLVLWLAIAIGASVIGVLIHFGGK